MNLLQHNLGFLGDRNIKFIRYGIYFVWTLGLIWSASFTELLDDEAYYWVYSQNVSLGYHDHPPFIAWSIFLGYAVFKSELGVRLLMVLFHLITIRLLEHLISPKFPLLFLALVFSIPVFQFSGFWAVPDTPFLFTLTLFLLAIKHFHKKSNAYNAIALGIAAAAVLYAKYHGALFVLFLFVFAHNMFKRPTFYLAIGLGFILYLPHVIWLIQHDFPTLTYHFGYRNSKGYEWQQTATFILGQFLLLGPILAILLFKTRRNKWPNDPVDSIFLKTAVSVFIFLFLFTFFGHVEGNWSLGVFPFVLVALFKNWEESDSAHRIVFRGLWLSIPILILGRLVLVYDVLPYRIPFLNQVYGQKEWVGQLDRIAKERPVVFMNSYQKASKFLFYSQKPASTLSNAMGRRSQFDLLNRHETWFGSPVLLHVNWASKDLDSIQTKTGGTFYYTIDSTFWYFPKTKIVPLNLPQSWQANQTKKIEISIERSDRLGNKIPTSCSIAYHFLKNGQRISGNSFVGLWNPAQEKTTRSISILAPAMKGKYQLIFSIERKWMPLGINSKRHTIFVE